MATTYTTNYNLGKQENHADKFDMDVITDNADKIDAALTGLQSGIDGKQDTIDASHKLSSDLVDDTNKTHKFATQAQLDQIQTNKTNILSGFSGCTFYVDINDRNSYTFNFTKRDATTSRYRYGLIIAGVSAAGTSIFSIFIDTSDVVTITRIAGSTSRTFTGSISYSGDTGTLTIIPNDIQYGGIRLIWFD